MNGITFAGEDAADRFCAATGAVKQVRTCKHGDALLNGRYVEIKQTANATGTVVNIRPMDFIPVIIWNKAKDAWFVVPGHEVVRRLSNGRGSRISNPNVFVRAQFTEAFYKDREVSLATLKDHVVLALAEDDANPELERLMRSVRQECENLADDHMERVAGLLATEEGVAAP